MLWVVVLECLIFVGIMLFGSFVAIFPKHGHISSFGIERIRLC